MTGDLGLPNHITDDEIVAAVNAGVLDRATVERLRSFAMARRSESNMGADEENLRFLNSFNDVFVTLGIVLFIGALVYLNWNDRWKYEATVTSAVVASVVWALAEFFTRKRRLALPSIVLLCVFLVAVFVLASSALSNWFFSQDPLFGTASYPYRLPAVYLAAFSVTVVASLAHWWRFHVPITVAIAALAVVGMIASAMMMLAPEFATQQLNWLLLSNGLLVLVGAIYFDMTDTARLTRRTDIAFWLHLLAAPMIVHSLVRGFGLWGNSISYSQAGLIFCLFIFFAGFALVIDRRALLVSSLIYLGVAFGTLIRDSGFGSSTTTALAVLSVGATVLVLSAGWRALRAGILRFVPVTILARVPPPARV